MLKRLTIKNYALIDALDISFEEGLNILTGETGAGKSIILGALSLLLGAKSDPSVMKDSSSNCIVEGEFDISSSDHLIDMIISELGEDNQLLAEDFKTPFFLRRVISPGGRSRSFFNDDPVNVGFLTAISSKLIDIHQQHQQLLLFDPQFQLSVLDFYAGNENLLVEYKEVHSDYNTKNSLLNRYDKEIETLEKERAFDEFTWRQLDEAKLRESELEELEIEQKQLSNAEDIKNTYFKVQTLFESPSIVQSLKESANALAKIEGYVEMVKPLIERIESTKIELDDIEHELDLLSEKVEVSPEKLEMVDQRISTLYSLMSRNNCSSVEELIRYKDSLNGKISTVEKKREEREELLEGLKQLWNKRENLSRSLHDARCAIIESLSLELKNKIRDLEMPYAEFSIDLQETEQYGENGRDKVMFLFSANSANDLKNISNVASGGELARIMLSLKAIIARFTSLPTMIFDEIDTGVSGSIADKMGDLIGELGAGMQILAITHLPQIASKRGSHFLVYKEIEETRAMTRIRRLNDGERINEVARMLSGAKLTEASLNNAKEMFENNNK